MSRSRRWITAAAILTLLLAVGMYARRLVDHSHREFCELPFEVLVDRMLTEPVSVHWLETPRLTFCSYGPGHFWATMAVRRVCREMDGLIAGRLVAFVALLATAVLLGMLVARKTNCSNRGLFTAILYIISPVAYYWLPANRVDALAVFLVCAAFASLGRSHRSVVICAALIAAGSVVKQPAALAAGAILAHLLLERRLQDACCFTGLLCLAGAVLWWALDWHSGGYYLAIAIKSNMHEMSLMKGVVLSLWFFVYPFSMLCVVVIVYLVRKRFFNDALTALFCLGFVNSVVLAMGMACKQGSHINYFLEASALGSVLIGICPLPQRFVRFHRAIGGAVTSALIVPNMVALAIFPGCLESAPDSQAVRALLSDGEHRPILVDPIWIEAAESSEHGVAVNEPNSLRVAIERRCLDPQPLISSMARGDIPWLVLDRRIEAHRAQSGSRWPRQVLEAMAQHYVLAAEGEQMAAYHYVPFLTSARAIATPPILR